MQELDKWQKEIAKLSDYAEDATNKKLFKYYRQALIDIKKEMKDFIDDYENLSFSKRLEAERLLQNGKQIDKILRETYQRANKAIEDYAGDAAERGYYGTWYALEGAHNVQLDMNMLPERYIKQLVHRPVKGKVFSKRLYKYRDRLAKETTNALLDAARKGKSYAVAAKQINELTEASYKQAFRIARTEGGRVQSKAKQRSYTEAKKKGVDLKKKWLSTLDKKTRDSHQYLDGQVVEIEEQFETKDGHTADGPRLFGIAAEDIHCRCTTITEVNGLSPELRMDNEGYEFPYKNYGEWINAKRKNRQSGAVSGALNNENDPDGLKRNNHAGKYYQSVRNRDKTIEVKTISKNTDIEESVISKAYDHVFINEYELMNGKSRFYPDYDMAQSWQRLRDGQALEHDLILVYHEAMEHDLMLNQGFSYKKAHEETNKTYNYEEALINWLRER